MKADITYFKVIVLAFVMMVSSCVSDDSFFPDETGEITSTIALVTILNELGSNTTLISDSDLCFAFQYPIVLGYNNDSTISIESFRGLLNAISGQSGNFNITGLQFPLQIKYRGNDTLVTIANEGDLLQVLRECEFDTFRDDFDALFRQCFRFDYPITVINTENTEVTIENQESLVRFIGDQNTNYQPNFKFPLNVLVGPNSTTVQVASYYDFYEVINDCVGCPNIRFEIELEGDNLYRIISGFEIRDDFQVSLVINGETISDAILDGNVFTRELLPGTYEVCVKVISPDCPEGKKVCQQLVVEEICPELAFVSEQEQGTLQYNFTANFSGIDQISYDWLVDDQVIEGNDGGANGDNIFTFQFAPGIHNVCIMAETELCPNGTKFCQEIIVCPELFFEAEQQGVTNSYTFTANFPGIQDVTYNWTINDEFQETDGGADGDNIFTFQFNPGASYEVCIVAEVEGCTTQNKFCRTIDVPQ